MGRREVMKAVTSVGIPCAHMAWLEGQAPPLPFAVFYIDETDGLFADNRIHTPVINWIVELYQRQASEALETAIEESIQDSFGGFRKTEAWVDEESCLMTAYYFTEIE